MQGRGWWPRRSHVALGRSRSSSAALEGVSLRECRSPDAGLCALGLPTRLRQRQVSGGSGEGAGGRLGTCAAQRRWGGRARPAPRCCGWGGARRLRAQSAAPRLGRGLPERPAAGATSGPCPGALNGSPEGASGTVWLAAPGSPALTNRLQRSRGPVWGPWWSWPPGCPTLGQRRYFPVLHRWLRVGGWQSASAAGAALPRAIWSVSGDLDSFSQPTVVCVIMCVGLCAFLVMFWNPKEVITPTAEELGGRCVPFGLESGTA